MFGIEEKPDLLLVEVAAFIKGDREVQLQNDH